MTKQLMLCTDVNDATNLFCKNYDDFFFLSFKIRNHEQKIIKNHNYLLLIYEVTFMLVFIKQLL